MRQKSAFLFFILGVVFLAFPIGGSGAETKKPSTIAELALYRGADRQQLLEEGAKKEGKLTIYTFSSNIQYIAKAFEKKYPFIKVEVWRGSSNQVLPKAF